MKRMIDWLWLWPDGLVWRVTFPRPQAIDAVRAAILSCQLPGATAVR